MRFFATIGTTHGVVDGDNFSIPDIRDKFVRYSVGTTYGGSDSQSVTLEALNMPSHSHILKGSGVNSGSTIRPVLQAVWDGPQYETEPNGSGQPFNVNTVPSYVGVYMYIKAKYQF